MENEIFNEIQQYRQPSLWILFWTISGAVLISFLIPLIINKEGIYLYLFIISAVLIFIFFLFIYNVKMITSVQNKSKIINFVPFTRKPHEIPLDKVKEYKIITYQVQLDYGSYGIHYSKKRKAYNISGNKGVLFIFDDIEKNNILIGSQKSEELHSAIQSG